MLRILALPVQKYKILTQETFLATQSLEALTLDGLSLQIRDSDDQNALKHRGATLLYKTGKICVCTYIQTY
jgi:hypothetical protein